MLNGTPAAGSRRKRSLVPRQQQQQQPSHSTNSTPRNDGGPIRVGVDFAYGSRNSRPISIIATNNKLQQYPNDDEEYLISSPEVNNNTSDDDSSDDDDDDDVDYRYDSPQRKRQTKVSENTMTSPLLPNQEEEEGDDDEMEYTIKKSQPQPRKRFIRDIHFWILCCWTFTRKLCILCWKSRQFRTLASMLLLGLLAAYTIPLMKIPDLPNDWKSTASHAIAKYIPNLRSSYEQHAPPPPAPPPPQSLEQVVERLMAVEAKISTTESQLLSALDRQLEENNNKQEAMLRELIPGKLPAYLDSSNKISMNSEFSNALKKVFITHEENDKVSNQVLEKNKRQLEAYIDHTTKQQVLKLIRDQVGKGSNPALIETLVKSAIERFSGAGDSPDYALITAGAKIIPMYTSATYQIQQDSFNKSSSWWSWWRRETEKTKSLPSPPPQFLPPPPGISLHPDMTPGMCWPLSGSKGQLGIKLAESIIITSITVQHIGQNVALDITTAPRRIRVYGEIENDIPPSPPQKRPKNENENENENIPASFTQLLEIEYDINGQWPIQTFKVPQSFGPTSKVIFSILDNWGNQVYTCLYKVRVHGNRPGSNQQQEDGQQNQQIYQDDQAVLGDDDPI